MFLLCSEIITPFKLNLKEILKIAKKKLQGVSQTPFLDAEILVGHILKLSRTELVVGDDSEVTEKQKKDILNLIGRRLKNEPIAYLTNQKSFYGLDFYVNENVLIPRPETDILVEEVVRFCMEAGASGVGVLPSGSLVTSKKVPLEKGEVFCKDTGGLKPQALPFNSLNSNQKTPLRKAQDNTFKCLIIDVGTGSGCIPISLAMNLKNLNFMGIDLSEKALEVAKKNIEAFGLKDKIELRKGDLLEGLDLSLQGNEEIIITANLPYVEDSAELEIGVKDYEPHLALFSGEDGLNHYRKLLPQAEKMKPIAIFLEIDPRQVEILQEISQGLFPEYEVEVVKDLTGKERVFVLLK